MNNIFLSTFKFSFTAYFKNDLMNKNMLFISPSVHILQEDLEVALFTHLIQWPNGMLLWLELPQNDLQRLSTWSSLLGSDLILALDSLEPVQTLGPIFQMKKLRLANRWITWSFWSQRKQGNQEQSQVVGECSRCRETSLVRRALIKETGIELLPLGWRKDFLSK